MHQAKIQYGELSPKLVALANGSTPGTFVVPVGATNPITGRVSPGKFISSVPGGCTNPGFWQDGAVCRYDYNLVAADTASLEQKGLFLRGDYQINDDWTVYLNSSVTRVSSFGRFAPTLADQGIFIAAGSVILESFDWVL